jgi:hypothetical protein
MSKISAKDFQAQYGRGATTAPATGTQPSRPKSDTPSPTNALTKAVIQLLQLRGWHAWRQNNGAVYDASFGGYRKGSATLGISDVLAFHKATARFGAVEIKIGKDTLTPEQTEFLADVIAAGGFGCEGRSLDQVDRELTLYLSTLEP